MFWYMCTMSFMTKAPVVTLPTESFYEKLEALYARRSALDALIESLEEYDLLQRASTENCQTA
jgi:hypothetical protein